MSGIQHVTHADVCTCAKCNAKANRIAAFGAIRRAAEVAREYEHVANERPYNAAGKAALRYRSSAIRKAIRAAIGSPKA